MGLKGEIWVRSTKGPVNLLSFSLYLFYCYFMLFYYFIVLINMMHDVFDDYVTICYLHVLHCHILCIT